MHGDIPCSSDWVSYPILFSTGYLFLWLQQERFVANWQMITFFFSFKKKSRANWNEWCIWDYCFSYPFGVSNCWMIHISLPGSETLPPAASDPWQEKKICREQSKKQHICGSSWKSGKEDNHSMDPMGYCKVRLSDWMMAKLILKALFPFTKWFSLYGSRINGLGIFPASSIYLKRFSTSRKSRFWSDKFNEEMCDLKFCLISGVEHPPTIFTGMGEIHQTPWLNSICVITSSQIKMSWKLGRVQIPTAYGHTRPTSGWKRRKSDSCPETPKYWQRIWMRAGIFYFSSTLCITTQRAEVVLVGAVSWQQPAC